MDSSLFRLTPMGSGGFSVFGVTFCTEDSLILRPDNEKDLQAEEVMLHFWGRGDL